MAFEFKPEEDGPFDVEDFDDPADAVARAVGNSLSYGLRRPSSDTVAASTSSAPAAAELPSDYLDIPAFLRRQAD